MVKDAPKVSNNGLCLGDDLVLQVAAAELKKVQTIASLEMAVETTVMNSKVIAEQRPPCQ